MLGEIGFRSEIGAVRESFFVNQVKGAHKVFGSPRADFAVDEGLLFEVGGEKKGRKQLAGVEDAFVVSDGIEVGAKGKIPLWLMGFLY